MSEKVQPTLSKRADELEDKMLRELNERIACKSTFSEAYDGKIAHQSGPDLLKRHPDQYLLMSDDRRLPALPDRPTIIDFIKLRCASHYHLVQSATRAMQAGHSETVITACLLHDIAAYGFIRCDHGYWGAQLVEPYVSEEVAWAIRMHQILRFFPDECVGYQYPKAYLDFFGPDYRPEPYIIAEYERARNHKWYMTARLLTIYDIEAFDPNFDCELAEFSDILARNFRQPEEGLGFDSSPVAHMWRTINWPTRFL